MLSALWESQVIMIVVLAILFLVPVGYSFLHYLKHGEKQEKE